MCVHCMVRVCVPVMCLRRVSGSREVGVVEEEVPLGGSPMDACGVPSA